MDKPAPTPSRAEFVEEAVAYLKGMAKLYSRNNEHTAAVTLSKCAIGIRTALLAEASSLGTKPRKCIHNIEVGIEQTICLSCFPERAGEALKGD